MSGVHATCSMNMFAIRSLICKFPRQLEKEQNTRVSLRQKTSTDTIALKYGSCYIVAVDAGEWKNLFFTESSPAPFFYFISVQPWSKHSYVFCLDKTLLNRSLYLMTTWQLNVRSQISGHINFFTARLWSILSSSVIYVKPKPQNSG